ncbi:hypothetical protein N8371_05245 [Vicingaceae bacterium]|nr:hypothetical protein [Vicingaceae bacterium]MDC1451797.1 hypothetical protein [Vicingaceae bacterium]
MRLLTLLLTAILAGNVLVAQEKSSLSKDFSLTNNKHKFFFFWGYNRTEYAKSDISWKGPGYVFTLSDVEATDLPQKKFGSNYYNPLLFTIPQFNFRVGFFLNDKYAIAAGWDHMKYRTKQGSSARFSGNVDNSVSTSYANYEDGDEVTIDNYYVRMEHSDGFNVLNFNLERHDVMYSIFEEKIGVKLVSGIGFGVDMPWTNSMTFGRSNDDRPHFSGVGAHAFIAPEFVFYRCFFARATLQGGFASMWDIAITPKADKSDTHAEQTIWYLERSLVVGYRFYIFAPRSQ